MVLITGCSSGIGRATAVALAKEGHTVYASGRRPESVADLAEQGCRPLTLDVTDQESAAAAVATIEAEHGAVGVLVNNAGYGQSGAVEAVPIDDIRRQFETNVLGYVRMAQLVLPAMRALGKGRIINVSSVAGTAVMPGSGIYSASKFAIEALSDALRYEVAPFGIQVVVVEPGPVRSLFTEQANNAFPAGDGPYAAYHAAVAESDAKTDHSAIAGDASEVADAIAKVIAAAHPRPRYRLGFAAHFLPVLRGALPDRLWDGFLKTQVKPPAPG